MKKSTAKLRVAASTEVRDDQPLFATHPAAALPLLGLIGQAKLKVRRPRLRAAGAEVAVSAYESLRGDQALQQRIADILVCNVSTRKYARVARKSADVLGISKSAVSRQFVKQSAQALQQLMQRSFEQIDLVAVFMDGIIVGGTISSPHWGSIARATSIYWAWPVVPARTQRWRATCWCACVSRGWTWGLPGCG
jgi:hypothetical protein